MTEKDNIKELFSKSFEGYEKEVDPNLWGQIQSKMNTGQTVEAGSKISLVKTVVIGFVSVGSIVGGVLFFNEKDSSIPKDLVNNNLVTIETEIKPADLNIKENISEKIEASQDPVIIENKEEIKSEILKDLEDADLVHKEEIVLNDVDINELLDHDLLQNIQTTESKEISESKDEMKETNGAKENQVIQEDVIEDLNENISTPSIDNKGKESSLEVPNVLTPNGDRINDEFSVQHRNIKQFGLSIATLTGKILFETSDPDFKWNGKDQMGRILDKGTYIVIVGAVGEDGKKYMISSELWINR